MAEQIENTYDDKISKEPASPVEEPSETSGEHNAELEDTLDGSQYSDEVDELWTVSTLYFLNNKDSIIQNLDVTEEELSE